MKKLAAISFLAALVMAGCYYDKTDEINPGAGLFTPCDTTHNVSYSRHLVPTLQNYCYSCHSGSNPSGGVDLTDYSQVYIQATSGTLHGVLYHDAGFNPMPPTNFQLDSCHLQQFDYWINAGAPNN